MRVLIDIETTFAAHWTAAEIEAHMRASVPGNYSKPESIQAWIAANGREAFERTALDYRKGWITLIGVKLPGLEPAFFRGATPEAETRDRLAMGQSWAVLECAAYLAGVGIGLPDLVTWNGNGFDLPWLSRLALQIGGPELAVTFCDLGDRQSRWIDLMKRWTFGAYKEYASLDDASAYLGYSGGPDPLPGGGAEAPAAWERGDWAALEGHCGSDLERLEFVAKRMGVL